MSEKYEKEMDKGIHRKTELNISSRVSSPKAKDWNQLDSCSVISNLSHIEDDYAEYNAGHLLYVLFRKQLYTDVTFYSKNRKDSFSAHRVVLAAKCEILAELLFGKKSKEAESMEMKVEISNLPLDIFKNIVEYFYTDEIDLEDVSTVMDILFGAKQFQIQSLLERCESYIESLELSEDNVCSILHLCKDKNIEELKNKCISYIQENTKEVVRSVTFEKCVYNIVYEICNLPSLNLNSEEELVDAIVRWVHARPSDTKLQLMKSLLPTIRFLTFSASEFGSIIQKHSNIMAPDDALKIMIFLNESPDTRSMQNLPAWCNCSMQRRCSKQDNIESTLKRADLKTERCGKVSISLKRDAKSQKITKQSSLLQIECMKGTHQINAVKFLFESLPVNGSVVVTVSITVVHHGTILLKFQKYFVNLWKEKLFQFFRGVKIYKGQVVNIKITTKSAKPFSLFQLDEKQPLLKNDHFQCCMTCEPADKKQFIISEVQYDP